MPQTLCTEGGTTPPSPRIPDAVLDRPQRPPSQGCSLAPAPRRRKPHPAPASVGSPAQRRSAGRERRRRHRESRSRKHVTAMASTDTIRCRAWPAISAQHPHAARQSARPPATHPPVRVGGSVPALGATAPGAWSCATGSAPLIPSAPATQAHRAPPPSPLPSAPHPPAGAHAGAAPAPHRRAPSPR